jgi:hypothetical protein
MDDSEIKITPDMRAFVANMALNSKLAAVDTLIQEMPEPETQMGILMMAQAKCFARIRRKHNITGARRKIILKKALADFEDKIRQFGFEDPPVKESEKAK